MLKIALISLNQKWEDKQYNLQRCVELASRAKVLGADLVIFPEMTLTGFSLNTEYSAEDAGASSSIKAFSDIAVKNQLALIAGLVLQAGVKSVNTLVAFSKDGVEQVRYVKIHPFSFVGEDNYFQAGDRLSTMQAGELKLGFSICYDLRFPELYSALAKDCEVLVNIANWPKRRLSHWKALLQARAIENQTYMIGVNRVGIDGNGLEYAPSSMIFDANGKRVEPLTTEGEIDIFELSLQSLEKFKSSFSTKQDRQPELYRAII
jgi:omega-amidase